MNIVNYLLSVLTVVVFSIPAHAYTRDEVKDRGFLQCGLAPSSPGFSSVDARGNWSGFDVDLCRAVAAAIFGDVAKVKYVPLAEKECFTALLSGEVDILSRHLSWTFTRDTALGVHFVGVSYYDGQGVLVSSKLGVTKMAELKNVKICSPVASPFVQNFISYLAKEKIAYKQVAYDSIDLAMKGFSEGGCDVISLPQSQLYGMRLELADPKSALVLPGVISKEPLGPVVRQGDDTWFNIVRWSLYVLIDAEELGVSSKNIAEMKISNRPDIQRFFGGIAGHGVGVGLRDDWVVRVISQVGNYGEIFARNFGDLSTLKLDRGLNRLWNNGGLLYAPPLR